MEVTKRGKYLYKKYGITEADYNRMLKEQKGGCWICGKTDGRLNVDHCHIKGHKKMTPGEKRIYTRGILCFLCNTMFSKFERRKKSRHLLERTVEYFKVFAIKSDYESI